MQTPEKKYIFDLDGTLYAFASTGHVTFGTSVFYMDLKKRILAYIADSLEVSEKEAEEIFAKVDGEFNGELSIGFEKTYGIDRYAYYEATWSCEPKDYIVANARLAEALAPFRGQALLLTAAPQAWASKVLRYLNIADIFGENIITGEPDIRKPDPAVFLQAAKQLGAHPSNITSIGDQNYSDIVPAKSLGMTTILIGPEQLDAHHRVDTIYDAINVIKEKL
jgi:putative hydrolase of the HAD superfamily